MRKKNYQKKIIRFTTPQLFEDLLEEKKSTKKWLFLPTSFILHAVLVTVLIITPLLSINDLPVIKTITVTVSAPPSPGVPGSAKTSPKKGKSTVTRKNERKKALPSTPKTFTAPTHIPDEIAEEKFQFPDAFAGDPNAGSGVEGGFEGGDINAIIGNRYTGTGGSSAPSKRVEQSPKLIKKVNPQYPGLARKAHIQGRVVIEAATDIWGKVVETRVISGHRLLSDAAIAAVRQWIYEPYIINGMPHPVRFTVSLDFQLQK